MMMPEHTTFPAITNAKKRTNENKKHERQVEMHD